MVADMQTATEASTEQQSGEELADTLTAISVVANRLAKQLRNAPAQETDNKEEGTDHGKDG